MDQFSFNTTITYSKIKLNLIFWVVTTCSLCTWRKWFEEKCCSDPESQREWIHDLTGHVRSWHESGQAAVPEFSSPSETWKEGGSNQESTTLDQNSRVEGSTPNYRKL